MKKLPCLSISVLGLALSVFLSAPVVHAEPCKPVTTVSILPSLMDSHGHLTPNLLTTLAVLKASEGKPVAQLPRDEDDEAPARKPDQAPRAAGPQAPQLEPLQPLPEPAKVEVSHKPKPLTPKFQPQNASFVISF